MSRNISQWRGEFGENYHNRNIIIKPDLDARIVLWTKLEKHLKFSAYERQDGIHILEVGAGKGINLMALNQIYPKNTFTLSAVEPNENARNSLTYLNLPIDNVSDGDVCKIPFTDQFFNVVFTSGVLIHVHPSELPLAFEELYRVSNKYIVLIEYFSPEVREVFYRNTRNMLWTGDFGGQFLDYIGDKNIELVSYGFEWKRVTGLDNLTWWIFRRKGK